MDQRDHLRMELSAQAQWRYAQLYRTELNEDQGSKVVNSMLERRAPMLLRLAMLFALTDLQTRVDVPHIDAAMAWIQYITASVRYVFVSAAEDAKWRMRWNFQIVCWLSCGNEVRPRAAKSAQNAFGAKYPRP